MRRPGRLLHGFRLPFRFVREGTARAAELTLAPPVIVGSEQDRGLFGVSAPLAPDLAAFLERFAPT